MNNFTEFATLDGIYAALGFDVYAPEKSVKKTQEDEAAAHGRLMNILIACKNLGIIGEVNEDVLDAIESNSL
jgi:hypothetical protein